MERLTDKLTHYQEIIQQLLMRYAKSKPAYGEIEVEVVFDTQRNHYQILHFGWLQRRWIHKSIIHLSIRNEKVWIFNNTTERDIGTDLVDLGVPKQDIVIGFFPASMRAYSGYGVE